MFDPAATSDPTTVQPFMSDWLEALVSTALLVLVVVIARAAVGRAIKRGVASHDLRRRWLVQTRNGLLLLLLLGLVIIWGSELRTLALSVVAIAVAFVVATKELILCVSGSVLKTGARSFTIGDRIQIKDIRGDVIDQNLLATTIMEIGPGKLTHQRTGRVVVIPNALFVSEPVINESYTHDFVLHVFTVPFKREDDWRTAQRALLAAAKHQCDPYLPEVRRHMKRISEQQGLDTPSVEPRVTMQIPSAGEVHLIIRVPAQAPRRGYVEQAILAECFEHTDYAAPKQPESAAADNPDTI
ncbi:mechanosensitive ion channel domain-containing protein [Phycisphaerales bacterium AB-hyl4]|uniref:Mechanosensitive ion channel domain-containing protein n=1 Tax=Natronomicrosphaera hydrolytica TaxID=3242702 RepID=A0ABV4U818_9BACT